MIDINDVVSVYSGTPGMCYCGCSGKHVYASKYRKTESKRRGYDIEDKEVNDNRVMKVVKIINDNYDSAEINVRGFVTLTYSNTREYTVYLNDAKKEG